MAETRIYPDTLKAVSDLVAMLPDLDEAEAGSCYLDGSLTVLHKDGWHVARIFADDLSWVVDFDDYGKEIINA